MQVFKVGHGSVNVDGSVGGCSPFTPDQVPAPVLQRRCQARPHFCEVMALYPVRTADAVVKVRIKNCEPFVRLQVSRKEKGSAAPKDFVVGGWRQNSSVKLRSGQTKLCSSFH